MSKAGLAARIAIAVVLLGTLQSACGGIAAGPAQGSGGSLSSAGRAQGGDGNGATAQGGGASAGRGNSTYEDRCVNGLSVEVCDAAGIRYHHDAATNQCHAFLYGGCSQGANNYPTLADCEGTCGSNSTTSCNSAGDCAVSEALCCTFCDGGLAFPDQFVAYNQAYAGQHLCNITTTKLPPGDAPAPDPGVPISCSCPALQQGEGTHKYFVPDCVQHTCAVVDLRQNPLTSCVSDADCRLRNGTSCCEACLEENKLVAVRNDGSYEQAMCGEPHPACGHCVAQYPPEAIAICGGSGHCEVAYRGP